MLGNTLTVRNLLDFGGAECDLSGGGAGRGGRAGGPATRKMRRGLYLGTLLHQHLSKRGRPNDAMAKAGKHGCDNLAFGKMSFVFYTATTLATTTTP